MFFLETFREGLRILWSAIHKEEIPFFVNQSPLFLSFTVYKYQSEIKPIIWKIIKWQV